jgi:two-component system, NtrC family, response regulator HydG
MKSSPRILVVDDHAAMTSVLEKSLRDSGYEVLIANSGEAAIQIFQQQLVDVLLCDIRMEKTDGFDVLAAIRQHDPTIPVILMTAFGSIDGALEAMRKGAFHYLTKPAPLQEVALQVQRAVDHRRLQDAVQRLQETHGFFHVDSVPSRSAKMAAVEALAKRVAESSAAVLIRGETGSGKELIARGIHAGSPRRDKTFLTVNCAAIPTGLLEAELFGYVRGAFTGATSSRRGLFVEADGGTLLLDEIGDMGPELQAKLLRILQTGEVRPLGSNASRTVDVRLLAATHQNLEQKVKEGTFRQDLFYRINVVPIEVPPLRERREDIPALAQAFLSASLRRNGVAADQATLSPEALARLSAHEFPGNVRELENLMERLVVMGTSGRIEAEVVGKALGSSEVTKALALTGKVRPLATIEREYIEWALAECQGNKTRAAGLLGIDVTTLYRKLREYVGS